MTTLNTLTILEVAEILATGNFRRFLSTIEHEHVECKRSPYQLKEQIQKIELAKDVSALANASGGYLLLGMDTERSTTHRGDEITKLCCFEQNLVDLDQYRKILDELVYPAIRDLKAVWHPWSEDQSKEIVAISIPAESRQNRPYLVAQTVVEAKATGKLLGFYERIESNATPTTVPAASRRYPNTYS
jgi:predicted HTH transcriptional regulator